MDVLEELSFFHNETLQALSIGLINCQYLVDRDIIIADWSRTGEIMSTDNGSLLVKMYNNNYVSMVTKISKYEKIITHNKIKSGISYQYNIYSHKKELCEFHYGCNNVIQSQDYCIERPNVIISKVYDRVRIFLIGDYMTVTGISNNERYRVPKHISTYNNIVYWHYDPEESRPITLSIPLRSSKKAGKLMPYDDNNIKVNVTKYTVIPGDIPYEFPDTLPDIPSTIDIHDVLFNPEKIKNLYTPFFTTEYTDE